jgi:hypothetical protein
MQDKADGGDETKGEFVTNDALDRAQRSRGLLAYTEDVHSGRPTVARPRREEG